MNSTCLNHDPYIKNALYLPTRRVLKPSTMEKRLYGRPQRPADLFLSPASNHTERIGFNRSHGSRFLQAGFSLYVQRTLSCTTHRQSTSIMDMIAI
jgi:hypothetical protein